MEDNVKKEIEVIKSMIDNWEKSYLLQAIKDGDNEYLIEDFVEEINTHVMSYIHSFYTKEFISMSEFSDIKASINDKVISFVNKIKNNEFDVPEEVDIDISGLYGQFNVHKDLIDFHEILNKVEYGSFIDEQKLKAYTIAARLLPVLYKTWYEK